MSEELSNVLPNDCIVYLRRVLDSCSMESILKLWPCWRNYLILYYNIVDCTQSHYGVHCSVEPYLWGSTLCTVCYGFNKVTLLRLKYNKEVQ